MKRQLQTLVCCVGLILITSSCTKKDLAVAGFTYVVSGKTVQFTDASTSAKTYLWDFGDKAVSDSPSPSHTYTASGTYTVVLRVLNLDADLNASFKSEVVIVP